MRGPRSGFEPNISCQYGCALERWLSKISQCGSRCSFIPHWTTHKKKEFVYAVRHRNLVIFSSSVNVIRVAKNPNRAQGSLEVLHCWWSHRGRKGLTCETKPVCLSLTGLLANRFWIIYTEHLHICSVVLRTTVSLLQPASELTTSHIAVGRVVT